MWMVLSFSVSFAIFSAFPLMGFLLIALTVSFWGGLASLFVSDLIDHGPIDDRGWVAQSFNVLGILIVAVSAMMFLAWIFLAILLGGLLIFGWEMD